MIPYPPHQLIQFVSAVHLLVYPKDAFRLRFHVFQWHDDVAKTMKLAL